MDLHRFNGQAEQGSAVIQPYASRVEEDNPVAHLSVMTQECSLIAVTKAGMLALECSHNQIGIE